MGMHLKCCCMDRQCARAVIAWKKAVDDNEVGEALLVQREGEAKACWTCAYDENLCALRQGHVDEVGGG